MFYSLSVNRNSTDSYSDVLWIWGMAGCTEMYILSALWNSWHGVCFGDSKGKGKNDNYEEAHKYKVNGGGLI